MLLFALSLASALFGYGWVGGLQLEAARLLFFALLGLAALTFLVDFLRGESQTAFHRSA
jgi:hypothetical protein